jgi:hypothetical protein
VIRLEESVTRISRLFKDFGMLDTFSGTGSIAIKTTANGAVPADFKRSLAGSIALQCANWKIQGVDLEKIIRETKQMSAKVSGKPVDAETRVGSPVSRARSTSSASSRRTLGGFPRSCSSSSTTRAGAKRHSCSPERSSSLTRAASPHCGG